MIGGVTLIYSEPEDESGGRQEDFNPRFQPPWEKKEQVDIKSEQTCHRHSERDICPNLPSEYLTSGLKLLHLHLGNCEFMAKLRANIELNAIVSHLVLR
jgi:hypothetical protein